MRLINSRNAVEPNILFVVSMLACVYVVLCVAVSVCSVFRTKSAPIKYVVVVVLV